MSPATVTGRAGRMRLRRQLAVAGRASELLDRKRRIIADELDRLEREAAATGEEWQRAAREAAMWLRRTSALDGQRVLSMATPDGPAAVHVVLGGAMGLRYPVDASVELPGGPVRAGSSALAFAATAHRRALDAAVRHAVATRAVGTLVAELARTRAHQRAIDTRWIPRLEDSLHALEMQLDELDREENVRLHWAVDRLNG